MDDGTKGRLLELAEGVYIESDVLGIVERIHDYDPALRVQVCAEPESPSDPPYRIMEVCPDGIPRLVFSVWELDERVMQRLYAADGQRGNVLHRIEANNEQVRERSKRRFREEALGEAHEITKAVIKSPKTEYTLPGQNPGETLIIHSHQPPRTVTRTGRIVPDS